MAWITGSGAGDDGGEIVGQVGAEVSTLHSVALALAPSTMLRMVPLPRFAEEDAAPFPATAMPARGKAGRRDQRPAVVALALATSPFSRIRPWLRPRTCRPCRSSRRRRS